MKSLVILILICTGLSLIAQEKKSTVPLTVEFPREELGIEKFHRYHIDEFSKAEGFGETRVVIMPKIIHLTLSGKTYSMSNMRLISVTDRKTPVIWEYPQKRSFFINPIDRSKIKSGYMKKRALDKSETDWVKTLRAGKSHLEVKEEGLLKIIAPLKAENACLRCHEDYKAGDFMGAFLYDMKEVGKGLNKKVEPTTNNKKKPNETQKDQKGDKVGMLVK